MPAPAIHSTHFPLRLSPRLTYLLSPVLVGLVSWGLMLARDAVTRHEHIRGPVYLTFFYLTVALIALLGGRGPGVFATLLTTFATALLLASPSPHDLLRPTSLISLAFNIGVGALLTLGMDAVRRNQILLAQSRADAARLSTVMDIAPVGIITCDMEGAFIYANPQVQSFWGQAFVPDTPGGWARRYGLIAPDGTPLAAEQTALMRAVKGEADVVTEEIGIRQPGGAVVWTEGRATLIADKSGTPLGGLVMLTDITERRLAEDALRASEARFRALVQNASDIITVLDKDGLTLYKSPSEERVMGYTPDETIGRPIFELIHDDDLPRVLSVFAQVVETPGLHPPVEFRIRHRDGSWRTLESVASNLLDDPAIVGIVVNSRDITARKDAEDEVQALLAVSEARAEREGLLNHIHQTLRQSSDPAVIQECALSALGTALKADRCCFALFDTAVRAASVTQDWRVDGLPSLVGEYDLNAFGFDPQTLFRSGATVVARDVLTYPDYAGAADNLRAVHIRSLVAVPLFDDGRLLATLMVAMADGPREWTAADVEMAETVTSLMWTATEAAQVQEREHLIAQTLQDALLPPLPQRVPGLGLDVFYRPALDEASIGGDFHDAFPLDKGLFALIVGDLSGKGLAAAAQVATVRNMLRYALYQSILQGQGVDDAVTHLNRVVTEHDLLTGFVTLFVGVYDAERGALVYANCGQEPALLHRAAGGAVDEMPPTGPVLGMASDSVWTQQTARLSAGDTLAVFTDGVTEAGRSRREFLGVEGVASLLQSCPPQANASARLSHLVRGLEAHAQGSLHDDVCLLVAVLEDASSR